ncbi:MAG: aminotransferase class V-fold PLP-dependent enzyme [Rubrimonas sp.]|uniref:aminotransferase class V-fold PLP-dependent enzyme n=1 Tax=Rubrimonas sp. TaxID=2036015 RepID=UPI002FDCD74C
MIPSQRALFDIPRDVAYLNCGYMGPLPRATLAAGAAGAARKARPWTLTPADFFGEAEAARGGFAALVGADAEGVALVPSASYGLSTAAANLTLGPGRRVATLAEQFPSNVYPWRDKAAREGGEVVAVAAPPDGDLTRAVLDAIDERCAIVALPNVLWTSGALVDLVAVGARARAVGAALVLDLTQSAGAMATDLGAIQPDFAVAAGYKWLLCPYATGFLWVSPRWRNGRPLEQTWLGRGGSEAFARLVEYRDDFQPGARRFDMGERSDFAALPAMIASLDLIASWTPEAVGRTLAARTARIAARLEGLGLSCPTAHLRGPHFLSAALPDDAPEDLVARLAARSVFVSQRGRSLRITPHLYNDDADEDRLIAALGGAL